MSMPGMPVYGANATPFAQAHEPQSCSFFREHGYEVIRCLEEYHPFPSEEHRTQRVYASSCSYRSEGLNGRSLLRSTLSILSNLSAPPPPAFISWNSNNSTRVTINLEPPKVKQTEAEKKAEAERLKKEEEERNNRRVMWGSALGAIGAGALVGKLAQNYLDAQEKLNELIETQTEITAKTSTLSGHDSAADQAAKQLFVKVMEKYERFYEGRIWKMKGYVVLASTFLVEITAVFLGAFYKSFRVRDAAGVASLLTVVAGSVFYFMYSGIDSRKKLDRNIPENIKAIRDLVKESRAFPPTYEETAQREENAAFERAGFIYPFVQGNITWTQHQQTCQWFWRYTGHEDPRWIPGYKP